MRTFVLTITLLASSFASADISLPEATKDGGTGIFTLLERRASATRDDFPMGKISDTELSTILWSASGKNRKGKGFTIPLTRSKPPYVDIFILRADGTFKYDFNEHKLIEIAKDDVRAQSGSYEFLAYAPVILIFATNSDEDLLKAGNFDNNLIAVGSIIQNIYLASDTFDISGRFIGSVKADVMKTALQVKDSQKVVGMMPLGKWDN